MGIVIKSKKKHKSPHKEARAKLKEKKIKVKKEKKDFLPDLPSKKESKVIQRNLTKTNSLRSLFGQESVRIQELLLDKHTDNAIDNANRALLRATLDLIPIAEGRYRDDSRQSNAYALNTLINQARELIADIQASDDKSVVTDRIVYDIIKPTMMTFAQFLIDGNYQLKRELADNLKPDRVKQSHEIIDQTSKGSAQYIQAMFKDLRDRVTKSLGES